MKNFKTFLTAIVLSCPFWVNAAYLNQTQIDKATSVVNNYLNYFSQFALDPNNYTTDPIISLFSNPRVYVYDNIENNNKIFISSYLENIDLKRYYPLSIYTQGGSGAYVIRGMDAPSEKKSSAKWASVDVNLRISGPSINKDIKNRIVIDLNNFKIIGITKSDLVSYSEMNSFELWLKGIEFFNQARNGNPQMYNESMKLFRMSADKGNKSSLFYLGIMYYVGFGGERDCQKAINYFSVCDENNNNDGKLLLATIYLSGACDKKDPKAARNIYEQVLISDPYNFFALYGLGVMYANGNLVARSKKKAIDYFQRAIDANTQHKLVKPLMWDENMMYELSSLIIEMHRFIDENK